MTLRLAVLGAFVATAFVGSSPAPAGTLSTLDTSSSDNKLLCMAEMVSNIEDSCSKSDVQGYYVALENLLKQSLGKCFHANFSANRALHVMLPDLGDNVTTYLKLQSDSFYDGNAERMEVVPTFVPSGQINSEVEFELEHNLTNSHDGWILDPMGLGSIFSYGGFQDLTPTAHPLVDLVRWDDIHPFFRSTSKYYDSSTKQVYVVTLPLDGNIRMLYYRADSFKALGLQVPRTWDEVVDLATGFNAAGVDLNGDNVTDYGFCFDRRKDCQQSPFDLISILAPYMQSTGSGQGVFFDPGTVGNLNKNPAMVDNAAMRFALSTYKKLAALGPQYRVDDKCDLSGVSAKDPARPIARAFADGRCLMGVALGDFYKEFNASRFRGSLGVAPMPGSFTVLNRTSNTLVSCTNTTCPHATHATLSHAPGAQLGLLNRAPFAAGGGWVAAVNARSSQDYLASSLQFFSNLSRPEASWVRVLAADYPFDPYRLEHFSNISRWVAAGYDPADTSAYLQAAYDSFNHPNIVLDLRVPGTKSIREVYAAGLATLLASGSVDDAVAQMNASFAKLLLDPQQKQFRQLLAAAYVATINYNDIDYLNGTHAGNAGKGGGSPAWLPIAIVLPTVGALLLIAAGVVYEVRNTRKHKNLFGKVVPPGLGADTTILITEIQDYSSIADALPGEVLDRALKEYGDCLRRLLLRHSGYEGTFDGDSFVMAFHSPKDALLFAMEAQLALLSADWPKEVLDLPSCGQLHVQSILNTARSKALAEILDAGDDQLTSGTSKIKALTPGLGADLGHSSGVTLPSLANVPATETYSFATACQRAWKEASKDDPKKELLFRGPRVRMGLHAGIYCELDISHAKPDPSSGAKGSGGGANTVTYSGDTVIMARAVAQAAQGGTVLLSEETYKKLPLERLWDMYLVLHVGEHRLRESLPNLNLYHALNRTLEGRLAYVGPTRSICQLDPGVLDAPVGCVTVAFMNVVGAQTLLSWNADVAQQAIKIFHVVVGEELKRLKGYLVEAVDGLFLAAFQRPSDAILWALECNEAMVTQDWPDDLLAHELCEELVISAPTKEGEVVNTVVFRGLRLKTGVDTGQVLGEVHAMTGRMTYRGKVMNRAARIASTASTGQVLCSSDSWQLAASTDSEVMVAAKASGTTLGQFRLKGVAEKIEIYHCRKVSSVAPARRASALVMSMADHWKWEQHMGHHHVGAMDSAIAMGGLGGGGGNGISTEEILLGPVDSLRNAMLSPNSFMRARTASFRADNAHSLEAGLGIEVAPGAAD